MSYWDNICKLQAKQTAKGVETYGQTLEQNHEPNFEERINYIEEELIDALMYLEWLKDRRQKYSLEDEAKESIRKQTIAEVIEMMVNDHGYSPHAVVIEDILKVGGK